MSQLAFEILLACVGVFLAFPLSVAGDSPTLPKCDPGTFLDTGLGGQDVCRPCPPGSFMDIASRARRCKWHRICKRSETLLFNGTRTSDVVCLCKEGKGRRYHDVIDIHSYTCRPCRQGEVVQMVVDGFDEGDRGCCPPYADAVRLRSGEMRCVNRSVSRRVTSPPPSHPDDSVQQADMDTSYLVGVFIGAAVVVLVIGTLIGLYLWRRRIGRTGAIEETKRLPCGD